MDTATDVRPASGDPAGSSRVSATAVQRRQRVAVCAEGAAVTGVAANAALALMFAIEVPKDGPFIFGTTNDVLGGVHELLIIPVLAEVGKLLPPGGVHVVLNPVTMAAAAAGAVSSALLVARVLPFKPSTAVTLTAAGTQAAWMVAAGTALLQRQGFPRRVARLGQLIGLGAIGGGATVALGYLFPAGGAVRRISRWAGSVPGLAAWLVWPFWYHLLARYLRELPGEG